MCDATVSSLPRQAPSDRRGLIQPHRTRQTHAAVRQQDRAQLRDLELVRHAAQQLGDDVLEGDQPGDPAVVVLDERVVAAALAQEREQAIGGHRLAHAQDRPEQARQSSRADWSLM